MIVKENISFERGIGSKKSLDLGLKRKDNIGKFVEKGLEHLLWEYSPKYVQIDKDGTKHWIFFYDHDIFNPSHEYSDLNTVYIYVDFRNWDKNYQKYFKNKIKWWFRDNTDLKMVKLFKNRRFDRYEINLK